MFKEKDYVQFTLCDRHVFGTVIKVEGICLKVSDGNELFYVDCSKVKVEKVNFSPTNKKEMVNHPDHYHPGTYEAINVIEAWDLNFNLGSAIKYISRCGLKPDAELSKKEKALEDLRKAAWYVNREIERLSK